MASPVKDRSAIDIRATVEKNKEIIPYLIGAHALPGCDTVGCYYGIGKGKVIKVLRDGYLLPALGDTNATLPVVVQESTAFIAACYGYSDCENMTSARQKMWKHKVAKSSKSVVKVSSLPPTAESFVENVKRAHLQACTWKHALDADPPNLLPENYGWLRNEIDQTLIPVTVPRGVALAPDDQMWMRK